MSKRKDRERAEGGLLFRNGRLVPEAQAKEEKGKMSPTQLYIEFSKALTIIGGRLFGFRSRRYPEGDSRRLPG